MPDALEDLPQPSFEGTVATDALETDGDNPNEMSDEQFGLLKDRMRQNGWLGGPIVTDTDGLIADGEHRWRAADAIGLDEVPVRQYDIDDATRRLWRQELNKIHGEHDTKRDALEYDYLLDAGKADEVHELTQAADEDLDELLAEIKMETSASPAYEYDPEHNVYFEDCVEGMRERVADDSVDCVITDPPYGIDYDASVHVGIDGGENYDTSIEGDEMEDTLSLWRDFLTEAQRVLKPDGHIYTFSSPRETVRLQPIVEDVFNFKNKLIWEKNNHTNPPDIRANYGYKYEELLYACQSDGSPRSMNSFSTNILTFDRPVSGEYDHPTQKPVPLISFLVEQSTSEGDRILDPFMGSGTTAVAAIQNDRDYVGFEVDADNYRDVIERRIGEAKRQRDAGVNEVEADD